MKASGDGWLGYDALGHVILTAAAVETGQRGVGASGRCEQLGVGVPVVAKQQQSQLITPHDRTDTDRCS